MYFLDTEIRNKEAGEKEAKKQRHKEVRILVRLFSLHLYFFISLLLFTDD